MAGICNASFVLKLIPYGFDTVTLGGFNVDKPSILAGYEIFKRGRKEFNIPADKIYDYILNESLMVKKNSDVDVSVNLRSTTPDNIIKVSKIKSVDIVEINCHCRQKEIMDIGCGQSMLNRSDLFGFIQTIVKNADSKVSVKIRANVSGVNILNVVNLIENAGADYVHIDAMKPGVNSADLDIITKIADLNDIYIIGNNSINSIASARSMLNAGANGISIARAAINGKLNFDLFKV